VSFPIPTPSCLTAGRGPRLDGGVTALQHHRAVAVVPLRRRRAGGDQRRGTGPHPRPGRQGAPEADRFTSGATTFFLFLKIILWCRRVTADTTNDLFFTS
jgi:hypothetical protein